MHHDLLMIALVLGAALMGGRLAARLGYPSILGEISVGILAGPPVLGALQSNEAIDVLGEFGILLMMLYIGMHLDLGDLKKASRPGLLAALGGFIVPTGLGLGAMLLFGRSLLEALFVGLAMGVTSLATKSRILVDLKILDTRIAHVLVAAALLSDVTVLVVFAAIIGPGTSEGISLATAGLAGLKAIGFGVGAWLVGTRLLPALRKLAGDRELEKGTTFVAVIVFGLGVAHAAELAGIHAILGAFVAGLFLDEGVIDPKASRDVQQKLATMSVAVLAPFFFVAAGFEVSLSVFRSDLGLLVAVVVLATVGKVVGTALFYITGGYGWREGVVVGAGMNGRGAVEIIVAELALAQGLIDVEVFSVLVFMALFTTATVPILLTMGVRWLRRRGELVKAGDRNKIVIVGAGGVARALGRGLHVTTPVTHLDTNRANQAAGRREGLEVISGSGLDEIALINAGIGRAMTLIAATPNAEVNILAAQRAVDLGVPEVVVVLRDSDAVSFSSRLADEGIGAIRAPEDLAGWEHATLAGTTSAVEIVPDDLGSRTGQDGASPFGHHYFPLVAITVSERFPLTDRFDLTQVDSILALQRSDVGPALPTEPMVAEGQKA